MWQWDKAAVGGSAWRLGSSISVSLFTYTIDCGTSHTWFASIISTGPAFFLSMLLGLGGLRQVNDGAGDLPAVEVRLNVGGRPSS